MVQFLCDHGADLNAQDNEGSLKLIVALKENLLGKKLAIRIEARSHWRPQLGLDCDPIRFPEEFFVRIIKVRPLLHSLLFPAIQEYPEDFYGKYVIIRNLLLLSLF